MFFICSEEFLGSGGGFVRPAGVLVFGLPKSASPFLMFGVGHDAGGLGEHASALECHVEEVEGAYVDLEGFLVVYLLAGQHFPEVVALDDVGLLLVLLLVC